MKKVKCACFVPAQWRTDGGGREE